MGIPELSEKPNIYITSTLCLYWRCGKDWFHLSQGCFFFLTFTINCTLPAVLRMSFWRSCPNIDVINLPIQLQGLPLSFLLYFHYFSARQHWFGSTLSLLPSKIAFNYFPVFPYPPLLWYPAPPLNYIYRSLLTQPITQNQVASPNLSPTTIFQHPVTHLNLHQAVSSSPFLPCVRSTTLLTILLK